MGSFRKLEAGAEVHILRFGISYCGKMPAESDWPKYDMWVAHFDADQATCQRCVERFEQRKREAAASDKHLK